MDLLAAIALVLVIEGLAIVIFAGSLTELLATLGDTTEAQRRMAGWVMIVLGVLGYLAIRG